MHFVFWRTGIPMGLDIPIGIPRGHF